MKRTQVLSAAAALLLVATAAQAQRGQDDRRGRQDQHEQAAPQAQHRQPAPQDQHRQAAPQDQHRQAAPQDQQQRGGGDWRGGDAQQRGNDQARAEQARADQARADQTRAEQARAAAEQNQRRAAQQNEQWRDQQNRQAQQQDQFDRARRAEQEAQLLQRERQAQADRAFERDRDDLSGYRYRYNFGGVFRETNGYGADVLRQAVNQGYDEGYRAGLNDRRSGAPADSRRALDFESGGFGYTGAYVPQSDYSYYFGEGFQRGYDDGYWSRSQYGTFSNGKAAILGAVALGILGLTLIH